MMEKLIPSPDQAAAIESIVAGNNVFLSGKAGTGKSFVIKEAVKQMKDKNIALLGTTGIAAMNVGGQTIHSFFALPICDVITPDKCFYVKAQTRQKMNAVDVIIIDEVSMLRPDVLDGIDYTLKKNKCDSILNKQFIFVGDLEQLPPVVKDHTLPLFESLYKTYFFNSSNLYKFLIIEEIELQQIHRQSDPEFIANLNIIRGGEKSEYFRQFLHKEAHGIILCPHVNTAATHNMIELKKLDSELFINEAVAQCDEGKKINADDFNIERVLKLKSGARIMNLVNGDELVNGSIGELLIKNDKLYLIDDNGTKHRIMMETFEKKEYYFNGESLELRTIGTVKQYPLRLAYAITIHKSQGLTFDKCTIDLTKSCFLKGQLYTAISRVKSPEGLRILISKEE